MSGTRVLFLAICFVTASAQAQDPEWETRRLYATRASLQDLLERYERAGASPVYSGPVREEARLSAARVRTRLAQGDFQTGDRIFLTVERESTLTDTFTVAVGPAITLPDLGRVELAGVLRAELQDHLAREISQFIRDPVVRTRTLIRIAISGEVLSPGFYVVAAEGLVTDALMRAGGPTRDAALNEIRVERDSRTVWDAAGLEEAIVEGQTLDQLGFRAGDRVVVPGRGRGLGGAESAVRTVSMLLSIPLAVFALTQIF